MAKLTAKRKIILDCDPGIDDAIAIGLCCASDEIELRGVTVTHGNVPLRKTVDNALSILSLLNSEIEVYEGADRPLVRDFIHAGDVHGRAGLGGIVLPSHDRTASSRKAVDFIVDEVMSNPNEITLCGIGPLTNIALALRLHPELSENIRDIVILGGSIGEGNTSPAAEFNVLADPHAARIVFESRRSLTMFGLDVTHKVIATPERLGTISAIGNEVGGIFARLLEAYRPSYTARYGWNGAAVHDVCTIAWLIDQTLFATKPMTVQVDTNEGISFGATVCDGQQRDKSRPVVDVAYDVDADRLFALLAERIARY